MYFVLIQVTQVWFVPYDDQIRQAAEFETLEDAEEFVKWLMSKPGHKYNRVFITQRVK